jgi:hypothetical protein
MGFFKNPLESGKSNFEKAINLLQETKVDPFVGSDTKEKEDGRFFLYNMEVSEGEYNQFMDAYNMALQSRNEEKAEEIAGDDQEKLAA